MVKNRQRCKSRCKSKAGRLPGLYMSRSIFRIIENILYLTPQRPRDLRAQGHRTRFRAALDLAQHALRHANLRGKLRLRHPGFFALAPNVPTDVHRFHLQIKTAMTARLNAMLIPLRMMLNILFPLFVLKYIDRQCGMCYPKGGGVPPPFLIRSAWRSSSPAPR